MQGCKSRGAGDFFNSVGVKEGCLSEVAPVNDSVPYHRKLIHLDLETRLQIIKKVIRDFLMRDIKGGLIIVAN